MELRGQANSLNYGPTPRSIQEPSSKLSSAGIKSNEASNASAIISPIQTLDQQGHLHPHPQVQQNHSNQQQQQEHGPGRHQYSDPDPAQLASAVVADVSNSKTPQASQSQHQVQQPPPTTAAEISYPLIRYRECLKNHAASMGRHVLDGCGEFMPGGEDGNPEALKCAACECHRNFHRKEVDGEPKTSVNCHYSYNPPIRNNSHKRLAIHSSEPSPSVQPLHPQQQQQQHHIYSHAYTHHGCLITSPSSGPLMINFGRGSGVGSGGGGRVPAESSSEDLNMHQSNAGAQMMRQPSFSGSKKRFRTQFTHEQKDKMQEFAEKLGWKMQRQDEQEVQQFCDEVGVKRQVFKVWMHNNKQAMKKKQL